MRNHIPSLLSTALMAALMAAMLAAGCQPKYTKPVVAPEARTPQQREFDAIWDAGRKVLTQYHFHVDRQDRRAGVMTTWPMVGKQWGELWRHDAARTTDAWESTVQTLYRSVKLTVRRKADREGYEPIVEVFVSRSDKPVNSINTTSDAYDLFTKRKKKHKTTPEQEAEQQTYLGHDRALEAKLTRAILKEAGTQ